MSTHSFIFFDRERSLGLVSEEQRTIYKSSFANLLQTVPAGIEVATYSTLGFKTGHRMMLHIKADTAEAIQLYLGTLMHSDLGNHIKISYTLLGMTRPSQYNPHQSQPAKETGRETEKEFVDGDMKYLIVYPFTKTHAWHALPFEERRGIMKEHVMTAKKHSENINQLLLYSYGIDDHEFIVSYQANDLIEFQTLVMDLRNTLGRPYTLADTPIFTCVSMSLTEALSML
jgi:chlorite dismutase